MANCHVGSSSVPAATLPTGLILDLDGLEPPGRLKTLQEEHILRFLSTEHGSSPVQSFMHARDARRDAADMRLELEGLRAAAGREQELSAEAACANDRAMAAAEEAAALRQQLNERLAAAAAEEELRARVRAFLRWFGCQ